MKPSRPVKRDDGLTVRHFAGADIKLWWCRFCWGMKPHKSHQRRQNSMDEVFAAWDRHKVSPSHVDEMATRSAVQDVAASIGRSSSGE